MGVIKRGWLRYCSTAHKRDTAVHHIPLSEKLKTYVRCLGETEASANASRCLRFFDLLVLLVLLGGGVLASPVLCAHRQTARDYGLIGPITQPAELSRSFSLFKFDLVYWSVLPGLLPVWIGESACFTMPDIRQAHTYVTAPWTSSTTGIDLFAVQEVRKASVETYCC